MPQELTGEFARSFNSRIEHSCGSSIFRMTEATLNFEWGIEEHLNLCTAYVRDAV